MSADNGWSRRNFLSARGLGAALGGAAGSLIPDPPRALNPQDQNLSTLAFARRAMGCEFGIRIPYYYPNAMAAADAALSEIEQLEELLTVYSDTSEMSRVNRNAFPGPVRVDNRLFQVVQRSVELHSQTDGAFDIAAGALVKTWGFLRGPRRVPAEGERQAALARSGMRHVELNSDNLTVRFRVQGVEINLGSVGKGYAIDRAIQRLRDDFGIQCALMIGGQSSIYGAGSPSGDGRGWLVSIQNPFNSSQPAATLRLKDQALGTSGTANQFFEEGGRRYGHLLDPRTGFPADLLASASAVAPDAATADALATAFFVMGLDKTRAFCQNHPQIGALLVIKPQDPARKAAVPQVVTFNVPGKDLTVGQS
ncbi:MAG: FAD:protein FMN transferase [Phycisphaerae bacterium]|nr:FAD:protein FMN transferase [Phycisphaerae bacterium]